MNDCIHHSFVLGNHQWPYTTDDYPAGCGLTGHDKLIMSRSKCPASLENRNIDQDTTEEGASPCTLLSSLPMRSAAAHGYRGCRSNVCHIAGNLSSGYTATPLPTKAVLRGFSQLSVQQSTERATILEDNQYSIGTLSHSEQKHKPGSVELLQQSAQNLSSSGSRNSRSLINECVSVKSLAHTVHIVAACMNSMYICIGTDCFVYCALSKPTEDVACHLQAREYIGQASSTGFVWTGACP